MNIAIQTINLVKQYNKHRAIDNLNWQIPVGQKVGLLGLNGSGKSTLINMLATLVQPNGGEIYVAGKNIKHHPAAIRNILGVVTQEITLDYRLSVIDNLFLVGALFGLKQQEIMTRAQTMLRLCHLEDRLHAKVASLSGGMKRIVDIIRACLHHPKILLLDEPTVGLDVFNRNRILNFLDHLHQNEKITIVHSTHLLNEAHECQQVYFLKQGRIIAAGNPESLMANLGKFIIEITGPDIAKVAAILQPVLGDSLIHDNYCYFKTNTNVSLDKLQEQINLINYVVVMRAVTLKDVYLWLGDNT